MAERIDPDAPDPELVLLLTGAIRCPGKITTDPRDAGDGAEIIEAWRSLLLTDRATLRADRLDWVPGQTDPRLLPPSSTCEARTPTPR